MSLAVSYWLFIAFLIITHAAAVIFAVWIFNIDFPKKKRGSPNDQ